MPKRTIRIYPDPVLKEMSKDVTVFDGDLDQLIEDMIKTMNAEQGVGLAAPQVGVSKRIIIAAPNGAEGEVHVFINPVITKKEGEVTDIEGCLSLPEASGDVPRAKDICVEAQDKSGKKCKFKAGNFFARILQHEIDHLNGILFIDHLGFVERKAAIEKVKEAPKL